eukprot:gene12871-biopygen9053
MGWRPIPGGEHEEIPLCWMLGALRAPDFRAAEIPRRGFDTKSTIPGRQISEGHPLFFVNGLYAQLLGNLTQYRPFLPNSVFFHAEPRDRFADSCLEDDASAYSFRTGSATGSSQSDYHYHSTPSSNRSAHSLKSPLSSIDIDDSLDDTSGNALSRSRGFTKGSFRVRDKQRDTSHQDASPERKTLASSLTEPGACSRNCFRALQAAEPAELPDARGAAPPPPPTPPPHPYP